MLIHNDSLIRRTLLQRRHNGVRDGIAGGLDDGVKRLGLGVEVVALDALVVGTNLEFIFFGAISSSHLPSIMDKSHNALDKGE